MFFIPGAFVACPDCGATIPCGLQNEHECDPERLVDFQMVKLAPSLYELYREISAWLDTPAGQFEQRYAARDRMLGRVRPLHPEMAVAA